MSITQNHFYSINAMQGHIRTISCESMPFHANAYICGINWTNGQGKPDRDGVGRLLLALNGFKNEDLGSLETRPGS